MNGILKRIGIAAIVVVAFFLVATVAYGIRNRNEMARFTPAETSRISDKISTVRDDFVNAFFIDTGAGLVAIDAGTNAANLRKGMDSLGLDPAKVVALFLTHTDYDHTAGAAIFPHARVYISDKEEQMVNGTRHRVLFFRNSLKVPYTTFSDGDRFLIGDTTIHAIVVPGHTPGMTCYLVDRKYLFTGDAIAVKNGKAGPFNKFYNMNTRVLTGNLDRINRLDGVEFLVTAHYGIHDYAKAMQSLR